MSMFSESSKLLFTMIDEHALAAKTTAAAAGMAVPIQNALSLPEVITAAIVEREQKKVAIKPHANTATKPDFALVAATALAIAAVATRIMRIEN